MGDTEVSAQTAKALAAAAPELTQAQLNLAKQFGTQFAQQRRAELEATDPEGFRLREQFMRDVASRGAEVPREIAAPEYERVATPAMVKDTAQTAALRSALEGQVASELAQAGNLPPGLQRATEQALRARGAASGNILGNAAALREALGVSQAVQQSDMARRQAALGLLQSGQTTGDAQARAAQQNFANIMAATGQRNTAAQQGFAGQLQSQQQQAAMQQQRTANVQSALGLAPIVSQAAQLGGLQQGASPFAAPGLIQGMQQAGPGQLMQMGSQFALQNAQNEFQASQANSPLAIAKGVTSAIGSLASVAGMCFVTRECIPDEWEAFYFWKELVAPRWFSRLYDETARPVAKWLSTKPTLKRVVASWMRSKINDVVKG